MKRIKFYSINDLTYGLNLKNSEKLIKEYEAGKEAQDINDIVEIYNVKKYFDNKIYLSDWTTDDIKGYENCIKSCFGMVAKFFKSISEDNLLEYYKAVEIHDFWCLIEKFKVYEKITEVKFSELIITTKVRLYELLKHKNVTEHFGEIIRDYMLKDPSSAELLLDKFEIKHISETEPLFFPKELSNTDKEAIINSYIDSKNPNLNYLRLIVNIQSNLKSLLKLC